MRNMPTWGLFLLSILVVGLAFWLGWAIEDVRINTELSQSDYMSLLTTFLFAALLAERLVSVLTGSTRRSGKAAIEDKIASAKEDQNKDALSTAQGELHTYRAETERIAMILSYAIGVAVALAGFRVLSTLLDPETTNLLFHVVDTLLSAGLIAGGSKGIYAISDTMAAFFAKQKNLQKQVPTG